MTVLAAHHLTIGYGDKMVASDLSLGCAAGTVTCLLGPNGVGKTTLFKTLLGLLPALDGNVAVGGDDLATLTRREIARRIAYVPQAHLTEFAYTVIDLVVMGRTAYLGAFGKPRPIDYDKALAALDMLGIADLAEREITRISGGQRQLAFIARALAQESRIIFMDEPTASLDLGNRVRVLRTVRTLAQEGLAIVLSTHEPEYAFEIADRVAVLGHGSRFVTGEVQAVLTADVLSGLYGVPLCVERTPSGRHVVGST
ncbi:MAG: ABC transporter ATP-binding protein [Xanthobacteraceae bacterium]